MNYFSLKECWINNRSDCWRVVVKIFITCKKRSVRSSHGGTLVCAKDHNLNKVVDWKVSFIVLSKFVQFYHSHRKYFDNFLATRYTMYRISDVNKWCSKLTLMWLKFRLSFKEGNWNEGTRKWLIMLLEMVCINVLIDCFP